MGITDLYTVAEREPRKNELCLCWLEGYKSHSAVKWGREGWALLVFHGKDVDGTDGQGWRLREKEDALKRYDMDTAEVLYWVRLPVIP